MTIGSTVFIDVAYEQGGFYASPGTDQGGSGAKKVGIPLVFNATTAEYESVKDDVFYAPQPGAARCRRSAFAEIAEAIDSLVRP